MLLSAACATPKPEPRRPETFLDSVRASASALLAAQAEDQWHRWLDRTSPSVSRKNAHAWLSSAEVVRRLNRLARVTPNRQKARAIDHLHALALRLYLQRELSGIQERINDVLETRVEYGGEAAVLGELRAKLASLDPELALGLTSEAATTWRRTGQLLKERLYRVRQLATELEYEDTLGLASAVRGYEVRRVARLAREVLQQTDALFAHATDALMLQRDATARGELHWAELPRLLRPRRLDTAFPEDRLLPAAHATLAALGIDLDALQIHIDLRALPHKNPRAACFPLSIPDDVRVSVAPGGGAADYTNLMHELGHALGFVHSGAQPLEMQLLGDASVSEAHAFFFESLTSNPTWLQTMLQLEPTNAAARVKEAALRRLLLARFYAARVLFAVEQAQRLLPSEDFYAQLSSRSLGLTQDEVLRARSLLDFEILVESADYLRGLVLGAQLRELFVQRWGRRWWVRPEATALLRQTWRAGASKTAEELGEGLGMGPLSPEALIGWSARVLLDRDSTPAVKNDRAALAQ